MSEKSPTTPEAPRMTPALKEALSDFETESRRAPENLDALRALKRENYAGYVDHLSVMSSKEAAGDIDSGRFYRNRLLYADTKERAGEIIGPKLDQGKYMGVRALELSGVVMAGIGGKIDDKVLAIRMERGAKRAEKRASKLEAWQAKDLAKNEKLLAKKEARRERIESTKDTLTAPYRRLSRGVMGVYARGLEASDPAKAAELKRKIAAEREKERRSELASAMKHVDLSVQSPSVQRLLETDVYAPQAVCSLENGTDGFVSAQFEDIEHPETQFALFYGRQAEDDTQLTPLLIEKQRGHAWTFAELPESDEAFGGTKDTLYSSVLTGMAKLREGINPVVSQAEMELLQKLLTSGRVEAPKHPDNAYAAARKYVQTLDKAIANETHPLKLRALKDKRAKAMTSIRQSLSNSQKRQKPAA